MGNFDFPGVQTRTLPGFLRFRLSVFGSAECGVQRELVVFVEEEEEEEDDAVEELLTGYVPLLVGGDSDGQEHHKNRSGCKRDAGEDAEDEGEAEDGFDEGDGVAESVGEAGWEWGFSEMICGGLGEGGDAVVDANQAVAREVDAERESEKRVGEGPVTNSHSSLDAPETK